MNGSRFVRHLLAVLMMAGAAGAGAQPSTEWPIHSRDRPQPRVVSTDTHQLPVKPPADAVVLFDGTNLSQWLQVRDSRPAQWIVRDGYFEVKPGSGNLRTRDGFGDVELHIEWASPTRLTDPARIEATAAST